MYRKESENEKNVKCAIRECCHTSQTGNHKGNYNKDLDTLITLSLRSTDIEKLMMVKLVSLFGFEVTG